MIEPADPLAQWRRTKIVATLGPATADDVTVEALVRSGMNVARINLSHGTAEEHAALLATVRRVAARLDAAVGVLADLPGPKLRVGDLAEPVAVAAGDRVTLGDGADLPANFPELLRHFAAGQRVLVDDGAVALRVAAVEHTGGAHARVVLEAQNAGVIEARKGVNLPDTPLPIPAFTAEDEGHLRRVIELGVDFVAESFVRSAADVELLKRRIAELGGDQLVVAKIEKREALLALDDIVATADALMIARGDLGVEIPPAEVPVWQKRIIQAARVAARPVITATQMLQSMISNPRPTRAEASDVANAIYDSTCAVMLSGETSIGAYPVEAVGTMAEIARVVEADIARDGWPLQEWAQRRARTSDAISYAACDLARKIGAVAIVTPTATGATARAVARYRPSARVVAVSPRPRTVTQLALAWGVTPLLRDEVPHADAVIPSSNDAVLAAGLGAAGDLVVMTAGVHATAGSTNLIKAHVLQ
ncbi:MAG: pyruvate kinase [Thermoleophilia bacterium]|nr:pyruvate kinase [Thermoleophilia bacterium]